jgi:hypothetical protein
MSDKQTFCLAHKTARDGAINAVMHAPDGYYCEIKEPSRTLEQNAKFWPMLHDISKQVCWYGNWLTPDEWKDFSVFKEWYDENYYTVDGYKIHLDKDILVKGNKVYSPSTCVFVPDVINTLIIKKDCNRGKYPVGVFYHKRDCKYRSQCSDSDIVTKKRINKHIGNFDSPEEAFYAYKKFKENRIKQVAYFFKDKIPSVLYNALIEYTVDIDD